MGLMPRTVGQAVADLTARFAAIDPGSARLDARVLVAHALGMEPSFLFSRSGDTLSPDAETKIDDFSSRRLAHEPVSRIVGHREFWGMEFGLTADTLDPRADTETLVSAVLAAKSRYASPRILDLGTGTGCILLAVLKEWPEAVGLGIDLNPGAVIAATNNARHLGLDARASFREGNWCEGLADSFDIIVSNPPYIADDEMSRLAPGVAHFDPGLALRGGVDGLVAYRAIIPAARRLLTAAGRLYLEIGANQTKDVAALLVANGFSHPVEYRDLAGFVRCLEAVTV